MILALHSLNKVPGISTDVLRKVSQPAQVVCCAAIQIHGCVTAGCVTTQIRRRVKEGKDIMLQIRNIRKEYKTGELVQSALDGVSLNLRDNEYVAVLGPSGSGKTTLLNMIGGLDRYDSGDLVINGISTKKYKDRDWDSYRNHTIGFVFQNYNLITHQSILANVELALTISGISKRERRRRAKEALGKVGLADHIHKRPNQMSGGQMQRVAIARALVNDPDILLADEPTGALDSETSVQVMNLLREVAKDRLVVMVTHNSELAEEYANRIVRLRDGKIIGDTNPYQVDTDKLEPPKHQNMGKASMSFLTSLSLSFNNLRTKKGRTVLTAFAGSIGIIGIALILAISTGVNVYIDDIQKSTMVSYPITINAQSMDLSSILANVRENSARSETAHDLDAVYTNSSGLEMASTASTSIKKNNLTDFKEYLDNPDAEIHDYLGSNGIIYTYDVKFDAYAYDPDGTLVNTDGSDFDSGSPAAAGLAMGSNMNGDISNMNNMSSMNRMSPAGGMMATQENFAELMPGAGEKMISEAVTNNYSVIYGKWPEKYDEVILVLDENNEISTSVLYELGILPAAEYKGIIEKLDNNEPIEIEDRKWRYEDICERTFYMVPSCDYYVQNDQGLYANISGDKAKVDELVKNSLELKIVGVAHLNEDASYSSFSGSVGYTKALTDYLIDYANSSPVVKAQQESPDINVSNGMAFAPKDDQAKIADTIEYLSGMNLSDKAALGKEILKSVYGDNPPMAQQMLNMGEAESAAALDEYLKNPADDVLLMIYSAYISPGSYNDNMAAFGMISLSAPSAINIYADSFEDKDAISSCIEDYNETVGEVDRITYTDIVALLMSSVTTIINVISYVLIAFVAVSLVVSSIMIGIITFISVLERTKEIGILRAIGASKRNIGQVFNAETFIVGFLAGVIGVGVSLLLLIPGNAIIHAVTGTEDVSASLPIAAAAILVLLSMGLTLVAGLIPARKAAKKDPVVALRTE